MNHYLFVEQEQEKERKASRQPDQYTRRGKHCILKGAKNIIMG